MITKRLRALVDWIDGTVLADIGCDHAYVAVQAVLDQKVTKAYACDIAPQPLERARETIEQNHVSDKVETLLMDGIQHLPDDVDCLVIAGMGAGTISQIVQPEKLKEKMQVLVSAHKDIADLRKDFMNKGIEIQRERFIYEAGHYYPILDCRPTRHALHYSEEELFLGIRVIKDETYFDYIDYLYHKQKRILSGLPTGSDHPFYQTVQWLENEKERLQDL